MKAPLIALGALLALLVVAYAIIVSAWGGGECEAGGRCAASPSTLKLGEALSIARQRLPQNQPIYVLRDAPLSNPTVYGLAVPFDPENDRTNRRPIHPHQISIGSVIGSLGPTYVEVTTLYGGAKTVGRLPGDKPVYVLRTKPGVRVEVYTGLSSPAVTRPQVRAWIRVHLAVFRGTCSSGSWPTGARSCVVK